LRSGPQDQPYTDDEVLQYAKSIDVSNLDSTLPSQPLEEWLLRGPARIDELNWRISLDCDLKDPKPDVEGDLPLCVKVGFRRGKITGFGVLTVGTRKAGIKGQPLFQYLDVLSPPPVGNYDRLSEFPRYLEGIVASPASPLANSQYFPAGVFDADISTWYSTTLHALHEPSIFALRDEESLQVYRFLWLPSFHLPISVRLTVNPDGSGSIVARSVDRHAGLINRVQSDTDKLIFDKKVVVGKADVDIVLQEIQRLAFWSMPTEREHGGMDGSQWILEGVRHGVYHVVDRWSPKESPYSELCKHLLRLAGVETKLY